MTFSWLEGIPLWHNCVLGWTTPNGIEVCQNEVGEDLNQGGRPWNRLFVLACEAASCADVGRMRDRLIRNPTQLANDVAIPTALAIADGALDLSVMRGNTDAGGHFLFHNAVPKVDARRSLSAMVLGAKGRFTKMGSEVRLFDKTGKILATRQLSTGDGYNSRNAAPVHFGLTSMAPITVEVTFMGRNGRTSQTIRNVSPKKFTGKSLVVRQAE